MLDDALAWASRGFKVFPIAAGRKDAPLVSHTREATTDPAMIRAWWSDPATGAVRDHNIGVSTTGFVVVDIDVRNGKQGINSFVELGGQFDTLTVRTPSGGLQCYYQGPDSAGRVNNVGAGLDIRSHGNYVIAPGSRTDAARNAAEGFYSVEVDAPLKWVPPEIERRLRPPLSRDNAGSYTFDETPSVILAGTAFLLSNQAAPAIEGKGGDDQTYKVVCRLRDLGVSEQSAVALLLEHWNDRCEPPWTLEDLSTKVENAYNYATGMPGSMAPEVHFAGLQLPAGTPTAEPVLDQGVFTFGNAFDPAAIPPRAWLYGGLLMRGQVSVLIGAGGAGKSLAALQIAAHLAMGQDFLTYRCKGGAAKSIVFDGEDDRHELSRRLWGICHHYGFPFDDVRNRIVLLSRDDFNMRIAQGSPPRLCDTEVKALVLAARDPLVGMVALAPLISLHGVQEDDNVSMAWVMEATREIARHSDTAVLIGHHSSKSGNGGAGDLYSARGAGAIVNSARFAFTLFTPSEKDCEEHGIRSDERHKYVRWDDAKSQYSIASGRANWLQKVSVRLANGDDVGVLAPYDMDGTRNVTIVQWATVIAAEMVGKALATCSVPDAGEFLRAGDMLAAKLPSAVLRSRVLTALGGPDGVFTPHGNIRIVRQGNSNVVILG